MLKTIISLATVIGICFSAYFFLDRTYARSERLYLVELRLDQKIEVDSMRDSQQRLWDLEKKCKSQCDEVDEREMKELKETIDMQKEKLRNILKDYYKGKG